jgi:hypothetical protein
VTLRQNLYTAARILGWVLAARRGRLPERAANVLIGRLVGRITSRLWR